MVRTHLAALLLALLAACGQSTSTPTTADAGPRPAFETTLSAELDEQAELRAYQARAARGVFTPSIYETDANGAKGWLEVFWHARHACDLPITPHIERRGRRITISVSSAGVAVPGTTGEPVDPSGCTRLSGFHTIARDLPPAAYRIVGPDLDLTVNVRPR